MNFIKKMFGGEIDEEVHLQLIRYGKGEYKSRAPISLAKTSKVKLKSGFEFANDFVLFACEFGVKFSGFIWSKDEIEGLRGVKKTGKWIYEVKDLDSAKVKEIAEQTYYLLLNCDGDVKLKIKKKLPKPGKDEKKIDDKFCQMEIGSDYFEKVKSDFFWDVGDCKKVKAVHDFIITEIKIPDELKDSKNFALVREKALRVGKIVRKVMVDGKEVVSEIGFEA